MIVYFPRKVALCRHFRTNFDVVADYDQSDPDFCDLCFSLSFCCRPSGSARRCVVNILLLFRISFVSNVPHTSSIFSDQFQNEQKNKTKKHVQPFFKNEPFCAINGQNYQIGLTPDWYFGKKIYVVHVQVQLNLLQGSPPIFKCLLYHDHCIQLLAFCIITIFPT